MYKKKGKIDTIEDILDLIKYVPIESIQDWSKICVELTQLAKDNKVNDFSVHRQKLKEIYAEYPELSKIKIFKSIEILRELKIKHIIE